MARIGIDCDGVLANFMSSINPILGLPADFEPDEYNYKGVLTKTELSAGFERAKQIPNWFLGLEPYRDNIAALARWLGRNSGHDVWIVTSRFETAGNTATWQTEYWLRACGLRGYDNYLGVITVPYSEDKVDVLSRLNIEWMIDDKAETIESMDQFPYLRAALMDRPWNQQASVKWRVNSMKEFLERIQ